MRLGNSAIHSGNPLVELGRLPRLVTLFFRVAKISTDLVVDSVFQCYPSSSVKHQNRCLPYLPSYHTQKSRCNARGFSKCCSRLLYGGNNPRNLCNLLFNTSKSIPPSHSVTTSQVILGEISVDSIPLQVLPV